MRISDWSSDVCSSDLSFDGTPRTTRPSALWRCHTASRPLYCGVNPHFEAVLTMMVGRPANSLKGIGLPLRLWNSKSKAVFLLAIWVPLTVLTRSSSDEDEQIGRAHV